MKALKSDLAKSILSDPNGKEQLRFYLASKRARGVAANGSDNASVQNDTIRYRDKEGRLVAVNARFVPKAA